MTCCEKSRWATMSNFQWMIGTSEEYTATISVYIINFTRLHRYLSMATQHFGSQSQDKQTYGGHSQQSTQFLVKLHGDGFDIHAPAWASKLIIYVDPWTHGDFITNSLPRRPTIWEPVAWASTDYVSPAMVSATWKWLLQAIASLTTLLCWSPPVNVKMVVGEYPVPPVCHHQPLYSLLVLVLIPHKIGWLTPWPRPIWVFLKS